MQLNQALNVSLAWHVSSLVSELSSVPLQRTPEYSKCSRSFLFFFTRSVLLLGKDGTAGKTITPSECVWHVPCLSPRLRHESASIASNRPQPCDTPCTHMHHVVAFRVLLSSLSPSAFLQTLFLYSALLSFSMRCPSYFCGLSSPIFVMLL